LNRLLKSASSELAFTDHDKRLLQLWQLLNTKSLQDSVCKRIEACRRNRTVTATAKSHGDSNSKIAPSSQQQNRTVIAAASLPQKRTVIATAGRGMRRT
jgi:hypothetical protein